jgi:hypothetical protein
VRHLPELAARRSAEAALVARYERIDRQAGLAIVRGDEPRPPHKIAEHHDPEGIPSVKNP